MKEKGITLIALVITIIVMLILVGVTVNLALNGGLIENAKQATTKYDEERIKEELVGYQLEYYTKTGEDISEKTIEDIVRAVKTTGIDSSKFIVYHDKYNIDTNKENEDTLEYTPKQEEYIFFDWTKVSQEEMRILENAEYKYLKGDVTGDGFLTLEDSNYWINNELTNEQSIIRGYEF